MTHPVNLTDLLQAIGPDNLKYQQLENCLENVKAKQGIAMVTFGTEAISPNDAATDDMPKCIIIWVDRDLYQQGFQALQRGEGQTYGQLQVQCTQLMEALQEARTGLAWYQDNYPEAANGSDDEAMARIDAALAGSEGGAA